MSDMPMRKVTLSANVLTFISVLALYIVEYRRELWCIEYLDIDPTRANDYLDQAIEAYPDIKKSMFAYNSLYVDGSTLLVGS